MKDVRRPSRKVVRTTQLRVAKRAQRERDREAGLVEARLKIAEPLAQRLAFASRQPGFEAALQRMLEEETVELDRYPQLKILCWNRHTSFVTAHDAWQIYEGNWRFIDQAHLGNSERRLIRSLVDRFGAGVMNA